MLQNKPMTVGVRVSHTSAFRFGAEPSANLQECLQDSVLTSVGVTERQRRLLSSAAASSDRASALILSWGPGYFNTFPFLKE